MSTITLAYSTPLPGNISEARAVAVFEAIPLQEGELNLLDMTVDTDVTAVVGSDIVRTLALLSDDVRFPTDAQKEQVTVNLYRQALAKKFPGPVTAAAPVVTP